MDLAKTTARREAFIFLWFGATYELFDYITEIRAVALRWERITGAWQDGADTDIIPLNATILQPIYLVYDFIIP